MVEAVLLGNAQDAGLPQAGCACARCASARRVPASRRLASCLGVVEHAAGRAWMIDATPDFREQLDALCGAGALPLAGILLTHAHIGHYTGLIHLGREAWNTTRLPVYATARMAGFLRANAPWSQLVAQGNIELHALQPGVGVALGPALHVTPLLVPHRDEWSDTVAFVLRGPTRQLLYCPDSDEWPPSFRDQLESVDVALLDGTFFSGDELPGRDLRTIPHPLVRDSVRQLAGARGEIRFIHLNHSNPLLDEGAARRWLAAQGFGVGEQGERWVL